MKNNNKIKFGDYVEIEEKRYGVPNESFIYKVIGRLRSNAYVNVPVQSPRAESLHKEVVEVVACVVCGVDEREILRYRLEDVKKITENKNADFNYDIT